MCVCTLEMVFFEPKNTGHSAISSSSKYITTPKFNKLTAENFTARSKQAKLATKGDIADFVKYRKFRKF